MVANGKSLLHCLPIERNLECSLATVKEITNTCRGLTRIKNGHVVFDTRKEAAYPKTFCERFANVLADLAGIADLQVTDGLYDKTALLDARAATHTNNTGQKNRPSCA